VRSCGVEVKGPYSLGDRFWSAYLEDPNGIRLEFATSLAPEEVGIVGSARQTEEEARAELATLFDDEADIDRWLAEMPLIAEEYPAGRLRRPVMGLFTARTLGRRTGVRSDQASNDHHRRRNRVPERERRVRSCPSHLRNIQ
jgi:hypothetical protein